MKKLVSCTLAIFLIIPILLNAQTKKPKRIIFMIGDGMGLAQISGALAFYAWQNAFARFGTIGLIKTNSSDSYVTDSAAGATAFSTGKKTYNGAIAVDTLGKDIETIFESLKKQTKWGTGVVVTSSITHATPAAFYAHAASRKSEDLIAEYLLNQNCDVAIGGGRKFLLNREDKRNLGIELTAKGFEVNTDGSLKNIKAARQIQTLDDDGMKKMSESRGDFLPKASIHAIDVLGSNYKNFFLMIEGSQIDWGGHDTDFLYMKAELLDFNHTINDVLDFAIKDGETLVVVTADHETGGLTLLEDKKNKTSNLIPRHTTTKHTGIMVPVFAYGPGAELFGGIYHNTEIYHKFKMLIGIK
ncbi:MAG: alkaline phosphatase [Bacteroidia bacterium]